MAYFINWCKYLSLFNEMVSFDYKFGNLEILSSDANVEVDAEPKKSFGKYLITLRNF